MVIDSACPIRGSLVFVGGIDGGQVLAYFSNRVFLDFSCSGSIKRNLSVWAQLVDNLGVFAH
jgi:hypothetical protein